MLSSQLAKAEVPPLLDVLLKQYLKICFTNKLHEAERNFPPPLNWHALSQSVPNTTPEMCQKRFYQLNAAMKKNTTDSGTYFTPGEIFMSGSKANDNKQQDPLFDYVHSLFKSENEKNKTKEKNRKKRENGSKYKNVDKTESLNGDYRNTQRNKESTSTSPSPILTSESAGTGAKAKGGPSMVIHVCDEAKNLRQDFTCPRDLLIQEMKYFAEYLSVDSQRLEEVDISVHCDIHIFDWLMRYVKRETDLINADDVPKLEPSNVISILISSDFLKMEFLVEECIAYCHCNLSSIVATPCNMNCVNDRLTQRIAACFTHNELEEVKDRKDKFKSKLFCKKIEKLFDPNFTSNDSIGNASTLFRCKACSRILTSIQRNQLPCTNDRMKINEKGSLAYEHIVDSQWDVSTYIVNLYEELKKWSYVYWRLWGIVNHLTCSRCNMSFQLTEFGHCQYHPERPQFRQFENNEVTSNPIGTYPCCNQRVLRFDPTGLVKGCRVREHLVTTSDTNQQRLLDDVIFHKSVVQIPHQVNTTVSNLNMFGDEEAKCGVPEPTFTPAEIASPPKPKPQSKPQQFATKVLRTVSPSDTYYTGLADNSDEDTADEDTPPKVKPNHQPSSTQMSSMAPPPLPLLSPRLNAPAPSAHTNTTNTQSKSTGTGKKSKDKASIPPDMTVYRKFPNKHKWENSRSIRWNQDVQREEDMRRLQEITMTLAKQRLSSNDKGDKTKGKDVREYPGGIFTKLEANFFNNKSSNSYSGNIFSNKQAMGGSNLRDRPPRGRQTQVRF